MHQAGEQIFWPLLGRLRAALRDDAVDIVVDAGAGVEIGAISGGRHPQRRVERVHLPTGREADHRLDCVLDPVDGAGLFQAEHAPQDDRGGQRRHLVEHIRRFTAPRQRVPALAESRAVFHDQRQVGFHGTRGEERGEQFALPPPQRAVASHQPVPQQQRAYVIVTRALAIARTLADGDPLDVVGVDDQEDLARTDLHAGLIALAVPGRFEELEHPLTLEFERDVEHETAAALRRWWCRYGHACCSSAALSGSRALAYPLGLSDLAVPGEPRRRRRCG
jgi:hypothetical protein